MSTEVSSKPDFSEFGLNKAVLQAIKDQGYTTPTPIQEQTIPVVQDGRDLLGQAQTGTGKTAAFALPLLSKINLKNRSPQVLVLAPTRELAIQVAESFKDYGKHMTGLKVLAVYGGQSIREQLRPLAHGVHVVVGTPGRVMDHIRRKTLVLNDLSCLVLDEADEMLNMGFLEDVEWVLDHTPSEHQIALFSATLPPAIRKIAKKYLKSPQEITIKDKTTTADTINQRYWIVSGLHKLDALSRILEAEDTDGVIIFAKTKAGTIELAERLEGRGFAAIPLNGDVAQIERERIVDRFKRGKHDVLVATDVAARGLDIDRISHVINYDLPHDTEIYVHRIGRTGRAGRKGEAILFLSPRDRWMLRAIERATRQKIEVYELPSIDFINEKRIENFKSRIKNILEKQDIDVFYKIIEEAEQEMKLPAFHIAAALAKMAQGDTPLLLTETKSHQRFKEDRPSRDDRSSRKSGDRPKRGGHNDEKLDSYRIEVGEKDGVEVRNIVGAIANEVGLDSQYIGKIKIYNQYSTVDLPQEMPDDILKVLKQVYVAGKPMNISVLSEGSGSHSGGGYRGRSGSGGSRNGGGSRKRANGDYKPRRGGKGKGRPASKKYRRSA